MEKKCRQCDITFDISTSYGSRCKMTVSAHSYGNIKNEPELSCILG